MKTSSLDPEVPVQPLSQCLELPLYVAWTEAAGVSWVGRVGEVLGGKGELSSLCCTGAVVGNVHHDGNEAMWWENKQEVNVEKSVVLRAF